MRPALSLALLLAAGAASAAEPHPFTVHDLVALQRISEPQPSPDGKQVVFVLRTTDLEANKGRSDLWMVGIDGAGLRQLTFSPEGESSPAWAPDGKSIYFLSSRGGGPSAVWRLPLDGGEARKVTQLALDVGSFLLSPDGKSLAVGVEVFVDCANLECTQKRLEEKEKRKATGQVYSNLLFRHWDSFADGRRSHLFVLPLDGTAAPVDVTKGLNGHAPTKPWGGSDEVAWTPDGKGLIFTAKDEGAEEAWSTNYDLFLAPADGSAAPKRLTAANKAWDTGPAFSPDGKTLAWRAMAKPGYEADRFRIMVKAWPDGAERELAPAWDRSPGSLLWSKDGKTLFATADHLGHGGLFAIDVATGAAKDILKDGTVHSLQLAGEKLLVARDHLRSPVELYTLGADGAGLTAITKVNAERLAQIQFGEPEQLTFKGAGGDTVYAWLVKPAALDATKKYPLAVLVHGGPQGSFANDFHYRWNPQTYAGAGYAALMIDFHGSTGYGQKFSDAIQGDWGGKPLEDVQKGLDAAIARYKWIDGNRVAALGASYGAFLVNWMAGMMPDRFRCLVSHDGNLDEQMAYFNTEELWFPEHDHEGTPWDNPKGYQKHNPVNLVKKWKAPMLVVHGGKDFRVVETQGFSTFTALQRRKIPSQLLYFPDENHWVLKPANSILWHETVLGWLDRWTK
ncbi:MAG TPA: S9 family peptidase [Myxococcales bacterium]|jgi:dipeptidyl aminopeptidase/acylaminoacyl peptidase